MINRINKLFNDTDFSEILKGSSVSLILRLFGLIIGYFLTLIIANLFGAEGLGDYVLAIIVLRFFTLISKLGLDTTSIRFISEYAFKDKWKSIINFRIQTIYIVSVSAIASSLLMFFYADLISEIIKIDSSFIKLNAFFVLPMSFFMINYQSLRGLKKILEFSFYYRVSQSLFSIIVILVLYQFFQDDSVPIYAYLISILIICILSFISFRYSFLKKSSGIISAEEKIRSYKSLFQISLPLMFAQSVQFIMAWTDKLMLAAIDTPEVNSGIRTNSEEVGIYHTAFKLSMFAAVALMSVNSIAAPKFAEMYGNNNIEGLKKIVNQSTKIIFWTTIPLVFIFFLIPDFLLGLFGDEFRVGVFAFILLSVGRLVSSFCGSVGGVLQMTGNQNYFASILMIGAIMNVILNIFLIPLHGINGAAISSMISLTFWNIAMVIVVKKKFGFYSFYIPFLKI
tara:strand:+ start:38715 stop:40073 length:1359 start_codon:yes stop_codon:yes gene_type:complete